MMNISIIGTGYVGLVTGVGLAAHGHRVICVDQNPAIIERLEANEIPIYENGLSDLFSEVKSSNRFKATTDITTAVQETEVTIIAVGTPDDGGKIDLKHIQSASEKIGSILRHKTPYHTVVVKSTVLPGTTDSVVLPILKEASGKSLGDFGLGFNPEFLREGSAVKDFMEPDRIVLGADDAQSAKTLRELYLTFQTDFLEVNTRTAEMIKYANNCLLATQISTSNEIANLAAALGGIDAYEVMRGVHLDRRWNPVSSEGGRINPGILSYLIPGCGFGGSCFPKDVQAFVTQGKQLGLSMNVLDGVLKTNRDQPLQVVELLSKGLGILKGKRVAILGLAFKPGTDDIRESPAIPVIRRLLAEKVQVTASDPVANERAKEEFGGEPVAFYANWEDAVVNADAVVILTAWDEYASVSADELKGRMSGDLIIDARNVLGDSAIPDYFRVFKIGCRSFPLGQ